SAGGDDAVDHGEGSVLGAQPAAGERVGRGVHEQTVDDGGGHDQAFWKTRIRSAATLTAMTAGALPVMSGTPIGQWMRSMAASVWPSAASFILKRAHLAAEPI